MNNRLTDGTPESDPNAAQTAIGAGVMRREVSFNVEGDDVAAWLFEPPAPGPHPVVVIGNGFALTRDAGIDAYGQRFAENGIAALVFDYRSFGASGGEPRQDATVARQLTDWRNAIMFARSQPQLRSDATAAWGFSFGGGHVLTLSTEDLGLSAVVAHCPFLDGLHIVLATPPKTAVRLISAGLRDRVARRRNRTRVWVPATAKPGELAVLTQAGALEGFRKVHKDWDRFVNRVTAAEIVTIAHYRPKHAVSHAKVPIMVTVAEDDAVITTKLDAKKVGRLPSVTVQNYPGDHFDHFDGPSFDEVVQHQIEFLRSHLFDNADPAKRP